jgi:hypothetical protein
MIQIIQETALPKLSQTSLYEKFNETSDLSNGVREEIKKMKEYRVNPEHIQEVISIMKLNGDAICKKAIEAVIKGEIIILDNKETSKIPVCLPYIIISKDGKHTAFVFANTFLDAITSLQETPKLMAVLEAAYLALCITRKQNDFIMNSQLMLTLCKVWLVMVTAPLQQKLYMKGDNLNKAMLYLITYFYMLFRDVNELDATSIPYAKIMDDKIDAKIAASIIEDAKTIGSQNFMDIINKIKKINAIRYKDLDSMYMSYFTTVCGTPLIFSIENISYLFLLLTSSAYKTNMTGYGLNKLVQLTSRKILNVMSSIV